MGGMAIRYESDQNPDGTYNIRNVPFFAEVPEGAHDQNPAIDEEWLRAALAKDIERRASDYMAPAHIRHHKPGAVAERAGSMILKEVRKITHEGEVIAAIFGDLVNLHAETFFSICDGRYPYRSVEVHDYDEPEINSIALLDSEVPFFRFPNLAVNGSVAETVSVAGADFLSRACVNSGAARGYLFNATAAQSAEIEHMEHDMARPNDDLAAFATKADLDELKLMVAGIAASVAVFAGGKAESDPDDDADEYEGMTDEEKEEALAEKAKLKAAADEDEDKDDEDKNKFSADAPPIVPPAVVPSKPIVGADVSTGVDGGDPAARTGNDFAAQGALLAQRAIAAGRDAKDAQTARYDAAVKRLQRHNLTEDTLGQIKAFSSCLPADAFESIVAAFEAEMPEDPAPTVEGATAHGAGDSAEVAAFATQGPDHLSAARRAEAQYEDLRRDGMGMASDKAAFLKINVPRMMGATA